MAFGKPSTVGKPTAAGAPKFGGKAPAAAAGKVVYQSSGRRISLKPSDQQHGGILDDVDVQIKELIFTTWDYNGQQEPQLALRALYIEADGKETEQYYSAGKLEHLVPSADGKACEAAVGSNKTGLNDNCNAAMFLRSIVEMGFPEDKIEEAESSIEVFEGTVVHLNAVAQKKRQGLQNADDKVRTILLVTQIKQFPWESAPAALGAKKPVQTGKVATPPVKASGKAAAAPAATNGSADLDDEAGAAILAVLKNNGGAVEFKKLGMQVFRELGTSPNRSAILNLVANPEYLAQEGTPWQFDGTTVSAA